MRLSNPLLPFQGEENITSAILSADGKILAVATISTIKLFSVGRRKSDDERETLRVQKLAVPSNLSKDGARILTISPDNRWLCIVRPNSEIYLARVESVEEELPKVLPQLIKVHRASRQSQGARIRDGSLGNYERTIRCIVFSEDSRIFASGDLSGCVDTWVLEDVADDDKKPVVRTNGIGVGSESSEEDSRSSSSSSDEDEEEDDDHDDDQVTTIKGEQWNNAESPLPRLNTGILLLLFRMPSKGGREKEDRLIALTSDHQLIEFDALHGRVSDWSRRNPRANLPAGFRGVRDRAMGALWDAFGGRQRLWLYGRAWLWMFDMSRDFPSPEEGEENNKGGDATTTALAVRQKRRRRGDDDGSSNKKVKMGGSGAGSVIPRSERNEIFPGFEVRRLVGQHDDDQAEVISLQQQQGNAIDYDDDNEVEMDQEDDDDEGGAEMARLRRGIHKDQQQSTANGTSAQHRSERQWWYTYRYRDILGVVRLNNFNADAVGQQLEVALVERPMWDVELPGRYVREYE